MTTAWAAGAARAAPFRTWGVAAPDSSESAKPTGPINAATIAASNRTRYLFRIGRFLDNSGPGSRSLGPRALRRAFPAASGRPTVGAALKLQVVCHTQLDKQMREFP